MSNNLLSFPILTSTSDLPSSIAGTLSSLDDMFDDEKANGGEFVGGDKESVLFSSSSSDFFFLVMVSLLSAVHENKRNDKL